MCPGGHTFTRGAPPRPSVLGCASALSPFFRSMTALAPVGEASSRSGLLVAFGRARRIGGEAAAGGVAVAPLVRAAGDAGRLRRGRPSAVNGCWIACALYERWLS